MSKQYDINWWMYFKEEVRPYGHLDVVDRERLVQLLPFIKRYLKKGKPFNSKKAQEDLGLESPPHLFEWESFDLFIKKYAEKYPEDFI